MEENKMKNSLIVFLIATLFTSAFAQTSTTKARSKIVPERATRKQFYPDTAVRVQMNDISQTIRDLGPYIASEAAFVNKKNKKVIEKKLIFLSDNFKSLKVHPVISTQGLSLTQSLMTDQLTQTVTLFQSDRKSLAHAKFTSALNLCVSCHTQSPGKDLPKLFGDKDIKKMKLKPFERGELFFITRDYESAMSSYDEFLMKSKKTDDDEFILRALERQLVYFVKIRKDFTAGKTHFEKYVGLNKFNEKINAEVAQWVKTLGGKSLWDNFNASSATEEEMEKFMKGFIADEEEGPIFTVTDSSEVYDLNLSSILLDYYNAHPETKHGAKILYWLAILDKRTNDDLFFSIGDYYLLSCMEKYSKDPVAKDCYDAYQEDVELNYTSGDKKKSLPADVSNKLENLKKQINYQDSDKVDRE
jgi:hypothetical protein